MIHGINLFLVCNKRFTISYRINYAEFTLKLNILIAIYRKVKRIYFLAILRKLSDLKMDSIPVIHFE